MYNINTAFAVWYFSANSTVPTSQTILTSQAMTTELLTESSQLTTVALPPDDWFNLSQLQLSADNSSILDTGNTSLLDNDPNTCMRPFVSYAKMSLSMDTQDIQGSPVVQIRVTGKIMDCVQPSALVYMDIPQNTGTPITGINKQECPFVENTNNGSLVTCVYECRPLFRCMGSARFGVEVQRLFWLTRSHRLEELCDIRAFISM